MINYFKLSKFFLYLVPFSVVIVSTSTLFPFIVGKYVFFRTSVSLALIFFLLGLLFQNAELRGQTRGTTRNFLCEPALSLRKSALVWAVFAFVMIFLLACFFGVDPAMSFWSNFERGEGGLQILYLGIFFLLLVILFREEKDWKKLFWISILAAVLVIFYGIGAHLKYIDAEMSVRTESGFEIREITGRGGPYFQTFKGFIGGSLKDPHFRFAGSLGNPAYTATYLIFALFYAGYLLLTRINTDKKFMLLIGLIIFFFIFFWLAATRGAFLGLIAAIIGGVFYFVYQQKKWRKHLLALTIILILGVGAMVYFKDTPFVKSIPGSRLFDISFSAETFQHRTIMWEIAIDGWKERPLLGWGPENFLQVFDRHFNTEYFVPSSGFGAWFDRAHSVYFDYLAETGILGLLSFLSIFGVFYWQLLFKTRTLADFDKTRTMADNNSKLLYEDITYKIRGAIFDVKKQLGLGHKEFIYQNALEEEFNKRGIIFEREKPLDVMYNNKKVGVYKPDFIIENKIILELKSLPFLGRNEKKQIWHYLRGLPYQLALLVNFGQKNDVQIERIIYAPGLLSQSASSAKSVLGQHQSALTPKSAKSVFLSPLESALIFALPVAYLIQGIVLFEILPLYINLFLFLAFATYKLRADIRI
ncbi:MAG: GxxExxY protein [bacterium]|nr:GxxExxY protein [bacterium]